MIFGGNVQQTQQLEKLVKVFGKGNLLEAIFIFLGGFQNMISHNYSKLEQTDHRNFFHFYEFINKTKTQPLDRYFKLKLSLQGLCLIYEKAYKILNHHNHLDAQEVIDKIYIIAAIDQELGKIAKMVEGAKDKSIKLLNIIVNPKGKSLFNNSDDFETKILKNIRELVNKTNRINNPDVIANSQVSECLDKTEKDKELLCMTNAFLYGELVQLYCKIHNINVDENVIFALLIIEKEVRYLPDDIAYQVFVTLNAIDDNVACNLTVLARSMQFIGISDEHYIFDDNEIDKELNNTKIIYADNDFIPVGIDKDILAYLTNSNDEDIAKNFEGMILAYIEHEFESINGERFEDVPDAKPETFKQKTYSLLPVEFDKRKISFYTAALLGTAFTVLLSSSILGKFFHNKYNITALAILGIATLALSAFTFSYPKIQQQKPLNELDQVKVNSNENKEVGNIFLLAKDFQ
ncbi:hypothetical protein [Candidatus Mesenet endosymbiont of Agriotes lineatus]|uniref:hypothetical protein n=1 Tax=Candidatus Mesenet endosymbiont of Agriotes lineatus TaxID=3077948 RepID=UPI0030CEEBD7